MHESVDVAVGDWVGLGDGLIRGVLPRRSAIVRQAAGRTSEKQTLAANVDLAFIVTSLGPELEPRRIERYLVTIWESGAVPEIVLTKADRVDDPWEHVAAVEAVAVGVPIHVVSALTGQGCDALRARLAPGVTAVLIGSSGVGKSTLVNRFAGTERMAVKETRADDDEGRHTTSHRELIELPGGGLVIDTPGIRELQLWDSRRDRRGVRRRRGARSSVPVQRLLAQQRARLRRECRARVGRARRRSGTTAGASCSASCARSRSAQTQGCAARRSGSGSSARGTGARGRGGSERPPGHSPVKSACQLRDETLRLGAARPQTAADGTPSTRRYSRRHVPRDDAERRPDPDVPRRLRPNAVLHAARSRDQEARAGSAAPSA